MNFVKVHPGILLNMANIREVRDGPSDDTVTLRIDAGGERWAKRKDWQQAVLEASTITKSANPGTFRLFYCRIDEDTIQVCREPVIAWRINDEEVVPVTLEKIYTSSDDGPIIEFPDGTVQCNDGLYQSCENWIADLKATDADPVASRRPRIDTNTVEPTVQPGSFGKKAASNGSAPEAVAHLRPRGPNASNRSTGPAAHKYIW
jgi:hypothetical protein